MERTGQKPIKIETVITVECAWPADDIVIMQKFYKDDKIISTRHIGIQKECCDQLMRGLLAAKELAEKYEDEYNKLNQVEEEL